MYWTPAVERSIASHLDIYGQCRNALAIQCKPPMVVQAEDLSAMLEALDQVLGEVDNKT